MINDNGAAVWLPSPDAACVPTTCGSGTAIPTEAEVSLDNGADSIQSGNFMNDGSFVISQPGCNFDPASDKIIVIPREAGSTVSIYSNTFCLFFFYCGTVSAVGLLLPSL